MKLKKIWPLEDKILIFGQALAKTYLILHLLMDNELVCLCWSMIKVEENYATEFYYLSLFWRYDHLKVQLCYAFLYMYGHYLYNKER